MPTKRGSKYSNFCLVIPRPSRIRSRGPEPNAPGTCLHDRLAGVKSKIILLSIRELERIVQTFQPESPFFIEPRPNLVVWISAIGLGYAAINKRLVIVVGDNAKTLSRASELRNPKLSDAINRPDLPLLGRDRVQANRLSIRINRGPDNRAIHHRCGHGIRASQRRIDGIQIAEERIDHAARSVGGDRPEVVESVRDYRDRIRRLRRYRKRVCVNDIRAGVILSGWGRKFGRAPSSRLRQSIRNPTYFARIPILLVCDEQILVAFERNLRFGLRSIRKLNSPRGFQPS